jgi:hypothetical protein
MKPLIQQLGQHLSRAAQELGFPVPETPDRTLYDRCVARGLSNQAFSLVGLSAVRLKVHETGLYRPEPWPWPLEWDPLFDQRGLFLKRVGPPGRECPYLGLDLHYHHPSSGFPAAPPGQFYLDVELQVRQVSRLTRREDVVVATPTWSRRLLGLAHLHNRHEAILPLVEAFLRDWEAAQGLLKEI